MNHRPSPPSAPAGSETLRLPHPLVADASAPLFSPREFLIEHLDFLAFPLAVLLVISFNLRLPLAVSVVLALGAAALIPCGWYCAARYGRLPAGHPASLQPGRLPPYPVMPR